MADLLLINLTDWTGGPDGISGIPKPTVFGYEMSRKANKAGAQTFHQLMGWKFSNQDMVIYLYLMALVLALSGDVNGGGAPPGPAGAVRLAGGHLGAHRLGDLVARPADRGAEDGQDVRDGRAQARHLTQGRVHDALAHAAPPGVDGRQQPPVGRGQQEGHTVGGKDARGQRPAATQEGWHKSGYYKAHKDATWFKVASWFVTMQLVFVGFALFSGQLSFVLKGVLNG